MFTNYKKEEIEKFYNNIMLSHPNGITITNLILWARAKSSDDDIKFAELAWKSISLTNFSRTGKYVQERILSHISDIRNKALVMIYFDELNEKK